MTHVDEAVAVAARHLRVDFRYHHVRALRRRARAVDTRSQSAETVLVWIGMRERGYREGTAEEDTH